MTPEEKELVEQMNEEITGFMNQLKVKYDMDVEFVGSFFFTTKMGLKSGTVIGEYSSYERLVATARSFMYHPQLRTEIMKLSLQLLYQSVDMDSDIPSTEELGDMLKDINDN